MTNKVYVKREFNTSSTRLFPWLTEPELIAQWFGPKDFKVSSVQTDLSIGGSYFIELVKTNQAGFSIAGKYLVISSPVELSFSLQYEGLPIPPPDSTVTFKLTTLATNKTQLSMTQEFVTEPVGIDMSKRTQAWEYMLEVLAQKI
ncbi:MAG: SRPBCC domain-containing protein [Roseivirga sp.]|nr:SRPBCC domain-containing protein [Roseivirga sp.]